MSHFKLEPKTRAYETLLIVAIVFPLYMKHGLDQK
jgi:hypothetical protein